MRNICSRSHGYCKIETVLFLLLSSLDSYSFETEFSLWSGILFFSQNSFKHPSDFNSYVAGYIFNILTSYMSCVLKFFSIFSFFTYLPSFFPSSFSGLSFSLSLSYTLLQIQHYWMLTMCQVWYKAHSENKEICALFYPFYHLPSTYFTQMLCLNNTWFTIYQCSVKKENA